MTCLVIFPTYIDMLKNFVIQRYPHADEVMDCKMDASLLPLLCKTVSHRTLDVGCSVSCDSVFETEEKLVVHFPWHGH